MFERVNGENAKASLTHIILPTSLQQPQPLLSVFHLTLFPSN